MDARDHWLTAIWPVVRGRLPEPPATVLELGCGSAGGFVDRLRADGYDATGIDPDAPEGPHYLRVEFERADLPGAADAVIASTSLHHVADPDTTVDRIAAALRPHGVVAVIEWDWQRFDPPTADWCFGRLGADGCENFLGRHRDRWRASGQSWDRYLSAWAIEHQLHPAEVLLAALDRRFQRLHLSDNAYFFPYLADTAEADEAAAIRTGKIRANRVDYVGTLQPAPAAG